MRDGERERREREEREEKERSVLDPAGSTRAARTTPITRQSNNKTLIAIRRVCEGVVHNNTPNQYWFIYPYIFAFVFSQTFSFLIR
jgi:hypothetical protein